MDVEVAIAADLHAAIREYLVHGEAEVAALAQRVRLELLNDWLQDGTLYEEAMQVKIDPEAAGLPRSARQVIAPTGGEIVAEFFDVGQSRSLPWK